MSELSNDKIIYFKVCFGSICEILVITATFVEIFFEISSISELSNLFDTAGRTWINFEAAARNSKLKSSDDTFLTS